MFLKLLSGRNKKDLSDEELASRYRENGDMALLGELYGRYMEMVFAVCFKYLKDEEESKDAVMQLFEKLATGLREHEVSNFRAWLHRVARNHCLMILRSSAHKFNDSVLPLENEAAEDMETNAFPHPSNEHSRERQLSLVEKGIEKLPPEQQQCVRLFYLEQKCYKEISEETGYDLKKVKSYIQNGKRNLKIFMEAHSNEK